MEELWQRIRERKHTAVVGASPGEPPPGVRVVRVRCDVPATTLGPLHEAQRKIEILQGGAPPLLHQARDRLVSGLRRRLLGEVPEPAVEGALVNAWNRLAGSSDRPTALLFDAVDAADDATLEALRRIVAGGDRRLDLPLVLVYRRPAEGRADALLAALEAAAGPSAVLRKAGRGEAPSQASSHAKGATGAPSQGLPASPEVSRAAPASLDLRALPADVVRVLRAGALVGSGFEANLVGALLGVDALTVLELMQRAAEAGVPVDDRGEGRFHLPEPLLDALRASTLPSLMIAQHRRLAELLRARDPRASAEDVGDDGDEAVSPAVAPETAEERDLEPEPSSARWQWADVLGAASAGGREHGAKGGPEDAREEDAPRRAAGTASPGDPPGGPIGELEAGVAGSKATSTVPVSAVRPPAMQAATVSPIEPRATPATPRAIDADDARAAQHLEAAGDLDASAERYLAAAQKAAATGAVQQAVALAEKVLATLGALPVSGKRRHLRARALIEIGRVRWAASTLADALEAFDAARSSLAAGEAVQLRAELAALVAAVCYDIGDAGSLARALDELTAASRLLLDAGDATGAARLLNDQAAVYVRMGDPVRATHLLSESRGIFEARAATDRVAMIEMAETDHLLAHIPLHVPARPGREGDALTMGLDHALAAERTYRRLDAKRELGRVWETMGRLELRKGRLPRAQERLLAAVRLQESIGDLVGLARSTAALSELLAASGREREALAVLADSIALNLEKGSPIGLAFNRRALEALARQHDPALAPGLAEAARALAEAESTLGRLKLPGESD